MQCESSVIVINGAGIKFSRLSAKTRNMLLNKQESNCSQDMTACACDPTASFAGSFCPVSNFLCQTVGAPTDIDRCASTADFHGTCESVADALSTGACLTVAHFNNHRKLLGSERALGNPHENIAGQIVAANVIDFCTRRARQLLKFPEDLFFIRNSFEGCARKDFSRGFLSADFLGQLYDFSLDRLKRILESRFQRFGEWPFFRRYFCERDLKLRLQ